MSGGGDSMSPVGGCARRRPGRPACAKTELTTLHGPGSSRSTSGGGSGRVLISPPRRVSTRRSPSRRRPSARRRPGDRAMTRAPSTRRTSAPSSARRRQAAGASPTGVPSATSAPSADRAGAPEPGSGDGQAASGSDAPASQTLIEPSSWPATRRDRRRRGRQGHDGRAGRRIPAGRDHAGAGGRHEGAVGGVAERRRATPAWRATGSRRPEVPLLHPAVAPRPRRGARRPRSATGPGAQAGGHVAQARQHHHAPAVVGVQEAGVGARRRRRPGRARADGGRGRPPCSGIVMVNATPGASASASLPPATTTASRTTAGAPARRRSGGPSSGAAPAGGGAAASRRPRWPRNSTRENAGTAAGSIGRMGGPLRLIPSPAPRRCGGPCGSGARRAR